MIDTSVTSVDTDPLTERETAALVRWERILRQMTRDTDLVFHDHLIWENEIDACRCPRCVAYDAIYEAWRTLYKLRGALTDRPA